MDGGVVAVAVEDRRGDHPHERGDQCPAVAAQHGGGRQARHSRDPDGAARHVVPGGVGGHGAQGEAEHRVARPGGEEGERQGEQDSAGLRGDPPFSGARQEVQARQLQALPDDGDDQEHQPPGDDGGHFEAAPPRQGAAEADERPEHLDEHRVGGLAAAPHVRVDADQQDHSGGDEEPGRHAGALEPSEAGGQEAGDGQCGHRLAQTRVQGEDDGAGASRARGEGRQVGPLRGAVRARAHGDCALQADRGPQEAVHHEQAVDGAQVGGGDGGGGGQADQGGVEAREQADPREQQENEPPDWQSGVLGWSLGAGHVASFLFSSSAGCGRALALLQR